MDINVSKSSKPEGKSVDKESSPDYVTFRKTVSSSDVQELRSDFQSLQARLDTWFTRQDERFAKIINDFSDIRTSIKFMSDSYEDLKFKTEEVTKRVATLESKSSQAPIDYSRISQLEAKIDTMEQQARMSNIEISNLPEKRNENLIVILEKVSSLVKEPINKQDIISVHRVPHATVDNARPKNIIVKFSSRLLRDNVLAAVRLHKGVDSIQLGIPGNPQKIYFNEHLTLKNKILFRETREAAKNSGFKFVWVKHGTIFARAQDTSPVIAIRTNNDLSKIRPKN